MAKTAPRTQARAKAAAPKAKPAKAGAGKGAKSAIKPAKPKDQAAKVKAKQEPAKVKPSKKTAPAKRAPAKLAAPPTEGPWSVPLQAFTMQGFAYGMQYPTAVFYAAVPPTARKQRAALFRRFETLLEGVSELHPLDPFADPAEGSEREDTVTWFIALADRLQQLANLPVYAKPRVLMRGNLMVSLLVPALSRGLQPTIELLKLLCIGFARKDGASLDDLCEPFHTAFATLKAGALTTSNTPRLVKAAVENKIAFQELPGSMVLYGIGKNSMLMDSTFTQDCSNIGARLAKYKHMATSLLRRAGLPAPANGLAQTEEQAIEIANKLGYPVVVKPADKDGGLAVQADLRTDEEVRWAYDGVRKVATMALVEKFCEGRDYRIAVFRGKAVWAKERQPAGVTGDGKSSIFELAEKVNADPRRGNDVYAPLKKLIVDEDAEQLLARDGLSPDTVPKKGEFVRLRRRANVSAGGTPIPVFDIMHPDNARLAERAAEVLGLDLAGVDLIMPDISQSWRDIPAAICEVNAQPELGGDGEHLYPQVLTALVPNGGQVPTVAVLGGKLADEIVPQLAEALVGSGLCVGSHDRSGVRVGKETVLTGELTALRAGRMLTMDRRVEAIVLGALDVGILRHGLPVQQIDVLLLTGDVATEPEFAKGKRLLPEMLRLIAPHCRNIVALAPAEEFDPELRAAVHQTLKLNRIVRPEQRPAFLGSVVKGVVAAARKQPDAASGT
jgi:cyanophycin synthetase